MRTQLLPHNKTAYEKVTKVLAVSDRTCVVHPTGTGKSYLIAAVSEGYNKVLILGPNTFVLDQVHQVLAWRDNPKVEGAVEYMTYTLLMYKDPVPTGYDLVCLDEFHRAGAPEWGDAVDRLLEANPQAKVLGTTATPIRYLDDNRDMADEIFGGNIASYMTLKDAWNRHILATPTFVTGLFEFDTVVADMADRITKSRRIDDDEKKRRLTRVNNLRLEWERSQGMPAIIRKHIDPQARRIIVFCGNVEKLKDMEQTVGEWFRRAGFTVGHIYIVHAYMTDKELKAEMDGFETDDASSLKLMLSVNMLNEGIHIPRVNAVMLLRTTSSKIIYLQQIGRCLTAANTERPVILDMVDNITTTNLVHDIREGYDWYEHQQLKDDEEPRDRTTQSFTVYDYTLGIQDAIKKLVPVEWESKPFEERLARATAFCEANGRVPGKRDDKEEMRNWTVLRDCYGERQEVKDLIKKYHTEMTREEKIEWLQHYTAENGRLPSGGKNATEQELSDYRIYEGLRDERPCDPRVQALIDRYSIVKNDERLLNDYIDFVARNKRLPEHVFRKTPAKEFNLADAVNRRLKKHPQIQALWQQYDKTMRRPYRTTEEHMAVLTAFAAENGRLPVRDDKEAYVSLVQVRKKNKVAAVPGFAALLAKYNRHKDDDTIAAEAQQVIDFIAANGRAPQYRGSDDERSLHNLMYCLLKTYSAHPKVQQLAAAKDASHQRMSDEELSARIKDFVARHNRLPMQSNPDERSLWSSFSHRKDRLRADNPEIQAIYDIYAKRKQTYEDFYRAVRDFCQRESRLPRKADGDIYRQWDRLRATYIHVPEVASLARQYGYKPGKPLLDIDAILNSILTFCDEHGRMPSTVATDRAEKKLGRHWSRLKRRYADHPTVTVLMERYPIQNRK